MYDIRTLKPGDSKQYRDLRLESLENYPEHFGSTYEQQVKLEKLYFERLIEEDSDRGKMVGVFAGKILVGICGVTFDTGLLPRAGEIVQMYVRRGHQNAGLGRRLMDEIVEVCKRFPVDTLVLRVMKSNHSAINVYEKCGYEVDEALCNDPKTQYMTLAINQSTT